MLKDTCILVNDQDVIQGAASKHACHRFVPESPSGQLHRAFSVFLFDADNKLLLQQRAASKVTFPEVWTNTCCSHQLHGQQPDEVDTAENIAEGRVPGAVAAAVRKLRHELGIAPEQLDPAAFKFLTRLHYCAADEDAAGVATGWGEHEMDFILFVKAEVALAPNADEAQETRYVTAEELRAMMRPESGLKWSPWFRIICEHFLYRWWADLDDVLAGGAHADWGSIHKLECGKGSVSGSM